MNLSKSKFFVDIIFIAIIIILVFLFSTFEFGRYLFAGDFRLAISKEVVGDQFLSLVSDKFSNNNFIYLSFYPLFFLYSLFPYSYVITFIFLIVPVLLFLSSKFVIVNLLTLKRIGFWTYFLICSASFYYAINPWFFNRYVHYTMQYSAIFFPLLLWSLIRYLGAPKVFNIYIVYFFLILYLGSIGPQPTVIFAFTTLFFYFGTLLFSPKKIKNYLFKGIAIFIVYAFSFAHLIYPVISGHAVAKSFLESETTSHVFLSLSRNSTITSAISGTNFFENLIKFPSHTSIGLFIFVVVILLFSIKRLQLIEYLLLIYSFLVLIILAGFRPFSALFIYMQDSKLSNFLWLIKDPNTYYLFFLFPIIYLFVNFIHNQKFKKWIVAILGIIILSFSIIFVVFSDYSDYKKYFKFIDLPQDYLTLSENLKNRGGRNLWIPSSQYVTKNFTIGQTHFPSPSIWLTTNKESTYYAPSYRELNKIFENEIINKECRNRSLITWIMAVQKLNVVVDKNSVNNSLLQDFTTEDIVKRASSCLSGIRELSHTSFGNIDVYNSNMAPNNSIYEFQGTYEMLNDFVSNSPSNVIFAESATKKVQKIEGKFSILNESYDTKWKASNGFGPKGKINLSSMLFDETDKYYYEDENTFVLITFVQRAVAVIILVALALHFLRKKLY